MLFLGLAGTELDGEGLKAPGLWPCIQEVLGKGERVHSGRSSGLHAEQNIRVLFKQLLSLCRTLACTSAGGDDMLALQGPGGYGMCEADGCDL